MNRVDDLRAFAERGGDAPDRARTRIAHGEDAAPAAGSSTGNIRARRASTIGITASRDQ